MNMDRPLHELEACLDRLDHVHGAANWLARHEDPERECPNECPWCEMDAVAEQTENGGEG